MPYAQSCGHAMLVFRRNLVESHMYRIFVYGTIGLAVWAWASISFLHALTVCLFGGVWCAIWRISWGPTEASKAEALVGEWCIFFLRILCMPIVGLLRLIGIAKKKKSNK
jgi:hypothetical protein